MQGKTVVITGGNAGIGKEAAVWLAKLGARVIITSRNEQRGQAAWKEIVDRSGSTTVEVMDLDLASFRSIRSFASVLQDRVDRLDVLVNNAGLILRRRTETEDGFEATFGINHLGPFLLTNLLLDRLKASAPARVVVVASDAHESAKQGLDFEDLQSKRGYRCIKVYGKSKLANIYFARELAHQLNGTGVTSNSLHPGFVRSEFGRGGDLGALYGFGIKYLAAPFAISPEKGARTTIYLASSPEVEGVTGKYFYKCKPATPSKVAQDDDAARRLWEVSEQLVASVPA
jgi:NAD(P)-dependent dehydrogenase (short-subunit alcohol dehydrogenase family)